MRGFIILFFVFFVIVQGYSEKILQVERTLNRIMDRIKQGHVPLEHTIDSIDAIGGHVQSVVGPLINDKLSHITPETWAAIFPGDTEFCTQWAKDLSRQWHWHKIVEDKVVPAIFGPGVVGPPGVDGPLGPTLLGNGKTISAQENEDRRKKEKQDNVDLQLRCARYAIIQMEDSLLQSMVLPLERWKFQWPILGYHDFYYASPAQRLAWLHNLKN